MSSVDLETLKMTGAGRAIAVLTSGGDAQGHHKVTVLLFCTCVCLCLCQSAFSCVVFL